MSASKSATKSAVIVTAPKIETAWKSLCSTTSKSDSTNELAIERLAKEVKGSALSIRDVQKVIRGTGIESSLVKVSHVEGLTTWLDLRAHAEFRALDLDKQLSSAVASYKLLGVGVAIELPTYEAVTKATKEARKVKNSKPKATAPKVKKASNLDAMYAFHTLILSLDFSSLSDKEAEALANIQSALDEASLLQA